MYQGLNEKDVDITEYVSSVPGISGILKHRLKKDEINYFFISILINLNVCLRLSDFHVHEIALDGTVLHLTSRTVPEKEDEIFPLQGTYPL